MRTVPAQYNTLVSLRAERGLVEFKFAPSLSSYESISIRGCIVVEVDVEVEVVVGVEVEVVDAATLWIALVSWVYFPMIFVSK